MSNAKTNKIMKRSVDAAMTVLLLLVMACQVSGEMAHEWIGMSMTALFIIHVSAALVIASNIWGTGSASLPLWSSFQFKYYSGDALHV